MQEGDLVSVIRYLMHQTQAVTHLQPFEVMGANSTFFVRSLANGGAVACRTVDRDLSLPYLTVASALRTLHSAAESRLLTGGGIVKIASPRRPPSGCSSGWC